MQKYLVLFFIFSNFLFPQSILLKLDSVNLPLGFNLKETYQNPYGAVTILEFSVPDTVNSKILVFQIDKNRDVNYKDTISTIYDGVLSPGFYRADWNGKNSNKEFVPDGIYSIYISCSYKYLDMCSKVFSGYSRIFVLH